MPPIKALLVPQAATLKQTNLPLDRPPMNILLRLNAETAKRWKDTLTNPQILDKPKVVVKNGEVYLKVPDQVMVGSVGTSSGTSSGASATGSIPSSTPKEKFQLIRANMVMEPAKMEVYRRVGTDACVGLGKVGLRLSLASQNSKLLIMMKKLHSRSLPTSPRLGATTPSNEKIDFGSLVEGDTLMKLVHQLVLGPKELRDLGRVDRDLVTKFADLDPLTNKYSLKLEYYRDISMDYFSGETREVLVPKVRLKLGEMGYHSRHSEMIRGDPKKVYEIRDELWREREVRERERKERERKEREIKRELKEKELKERELKEKELKEREFKEKELRERTLKENELKERKLKERELKELKLSELKSKQSKLLEAKVSEVKLPEVSKKRKSPSPFESSKRHRTISDSSDSSTNSMRSMIDSSKDSESSMATSSSSEESDSSISQRLMSAYKAFKSKYPQYTQMYRKLSGAKVRSKGDFLKLMQLETELRQLKQQLWREQKLRDRST